MLPPLDDGPPASRVVVWPRESATAQSARRLADVLRTEAVGEMVDALITLQGGLGTGKTSFVRHLLRHLGVESRVRSPTYTLLETYRVQSPAGSIQIAHFDFYRFDDPSEWIDAGLREPFESPGLKLVEWPEKAGDLLPLADLALRLDVLQGGASSDDEPRRLSADALTARARPWLAAWLDEAGACA